MDQEETRELMRAILGGFQEQKAVLDGLKNEVAHLAQRITAVEQRLGSVEDRLGSLEQRMESVEQGLSELRGELHAGLDHLGERWLQHDRDIYTLKHRQA